MRMPIERILCPVDFSEYSAAAFQYALSLAQQYKAKLIVLNVAEIWKFPSACFAATADEYMDFCKRLRASAEQQLNQFALMYSSSEFHPDIVVHEGTAADTILSYARNKAVSLIVMGTHGVRGFDRVVLGSVTEKVLRKSMCSVLAVHQTSPRQIEEVKWGMQLHEVLFCTDFSDHSDRALEYALSIAAEYRANLTLLHVVDAMATSDTKPDVEKALEHLNGLTLGQMNGQGNISSVVRVGRACRAISCLAKEKRADLIIMAVHGRNALDNAVFGSTTYRVVCLGDTPVLAVH
jgi:nucleotide-binding universal stress UspA family protein